jgi:hypothetical protein
VIGGGDDDRVHVLTVQDFPVVKRAVNFVGILRGRDTLLVDIARRYELTGVLVLLSVAPEPLGDIKAAATDADGGDVDAVVGADHSALNR